MPKAIQVDIKEPCHENWQHMTPNEQGRHCMSCQKTVIDFTLMSDKEIVDYMSKASSSVCGRLDNHQMNRNIVEQPNKRRSTFAYIWNVVVATFLVAGTAKAQDTTTKAKKEQFQVKWEELKQENFKTSVDVVLRDTSIKYITMGLMITKPPALAGLVLDEVTLQPIGFASVMVKGNTRGLSTDKDGNFSVKDLTKKQGLQIQISAVGYETQFVPSASFTTGRALTIYLKQKAQELDSVVVRGFPIVGKLTQTYTETTRTSIAGGISLCYKESKVEKVKNIFADLVPPVFKNDVKVFPSPVVRSNPLNIALKLKETGAYKLELIDVAGRVVHVQPLQITAKEQRATLATDASWSAGMYWVRITGQHTKNVYQAKVLVQ